MRADYQYHRIECARRGEHTPSYYSRTVYAQVDETTPLYVDQKMFMLMRTRDTLWPVVSV